MANAQNRRRKTKTKTVRKGRKRAANPTDRVAIEAEKRSQDAVRLRIAGKTLDAIAVELGYAGRSSARQAILRALSDARMDNSPKIERLRAEEVERTYEIERELWDQWYRSCEDAVKEIVKEETIDAADDDKDEVGGDRLQKEFTRTVEGQSGNPAIIDKILKAMERRANLLGLDAPKKVDLEASVENLPPMGAEDLAARRRALEIAKQEGLCT